MRCNNTHSGSPASALYQAPRLLGSALLLAVLAGCAAQGASTGNGAANVAAMHGATPAGPKLNAFLDKASPGSAIQLPQSPWGKNVGVITQERYMAASGRSCLRLNVAHDMAPAGLPRRALACKVEGQGWYIQRLVTQVLQAGSQ